MHLAEFEIASSSSESGSISSINSNSAFKKNQTKRALKSANSATKHPNTHLPDILSPVISIMREKNDDQVKLNFTLSVFLGGVKISFVDNRSRTNSIALTRIQSQIDLNNIYEKIIFKLKKFEIIDCDQIGNSATTENVLLTSDPNVYDSSINVNKKVERLFFK